MSYYVYILLDDRYPGNYDNDYYYGVNHKPFYVGKGYYETKNKVKRHLIHYVKCKNMGEKNVNIHKCRTIQILQENNFEPNYIIVYEDNDENRVLEVESELINFYGKKINGGLLTNITDGGVGGDITRFVPGLKEKLRKISSERWSGDKNPNYKKPLDENHSHLYKKNNGVHWNKGKTMSDELKNKLKKIRQERLPIIEMLDVNTGEVLDKLTTIVAIKKYQLNDSRLYTCLNKGGVHKGYHWKYYNEELVILKSLQETYVKPKKENIKRKKVYFKYDINDVTEYEYLDVNEASKYHNICVGVIRRKCGKNNKTTNIFRYENSEYKIELTGDGKKPIIRIDSEGVKTVYKSVTEAANSIENGSPSMIVSVCKGKRKKHKGYKFEYLK